MPGEAQPDTSLPAPPREPPAGPVELPVTAVAEGQKSARSNNEAVRLAVNAAGNVADFLPRFGILKTANTRKAVRRCIAACEVAHKWIAKDIRWCAVQKMDIRALGAILILSR